MLWGNRALVLGLLPIFEAPKDRALTFRNTLSVFNAGTFSTIGLVTGNGKATIQLKSTMGTAVMNVEGS